MIGLDPAVPALIDVLEQLAGVVGTLTPSQYVGRPAAFAGSCIGTHVRHCIDHVAALVSASESGILDYDRRQRGSLIEIDPAAALEALRKGIADLGALPAEAIRRPLALRGVLSAAGRSVTIPSNMERELAYVLSHTTHHNAIIGFLTHAAGGATPDHFGYAASTVAFLTETRCAR